MAKTKIHLSDHFTYGRLIRFALPSAAMMLFTSIYSVVDGLFISNVVGETAFAALNLIFPYCMIFSALGSLFGVGGSALVALVRGQGDQERANRIFSLLIYVIIAAGLILTVLAQAFLPGVAHRMGAKGELQEISVLYGRIFLLTLPAFMLQYAFQSLFITAERPRLGLVFTLAAGISNMILDWLFVAVLRWGVAGAAAASCIGQCIGGIGPLFFFRFSRTSPLGLGKTSFMPRELLRAASNGMADFITNVAMSLVNIVYNIQLMRYLGEFGVSAYGIIMYVNFVFVSVYLGYIMGVGPVFSFAYGAGNSKELKSLFRKSVFLITVTSAVMTALSELTALPVAKVFAGYDAEFLKISVRALQIYSVSYLFAGINIFGSGFFASLNNGLISGSLSALRIFVFQLAAVFLLPLIWGSDGIWLSMPLAEFLVFLVTLAVLRIQRKNYPY